MGHWNVSHLTLDKFDQIKLFLLDNLYSLLDYYFMYVCQIFIKHAVS